MSVSNHTAKDSIKPTRNYEVHGDTGTRLYRIWKSMKCRCTLHTHPSYKNYGARGITICSEWLNSYSAFKSWAIAHGYSDYLELDRINVNGNYEPNNCRWITHHSQTINRRDTLYANINGRKTTIVDLCNDYGLSKNTVNNWRHLNVLEEKLSEIFGTSVIVTGGKKGVV